MATRLLKTEVTVPLSYLDGANAAYIRRDVLSDETALANMMRSIRRTGLILPLLIMPDYQVIDGAIRLEALRQLEATYIPVVVANDWDVAKAYFIEVLRLAAEGNAPKWKWWLDEGEVIERYLKPLYEPVRKANVAPRGTGIRARLGPKARRTARQGRIYDDLEQMFGRSAHKLAALRDLSTTLRRIDGFMGPEAVKQAVAMIEQSQVDGVSIYGVLDLARRTVRTNTVESPAPRRTNLASAKGQVEALERFALVLGSLAQQAQQLLPIQSLVSVHDAERLGAAFRAATRQITPLGAALRDHARTSQERENTK